MNPREYLALAAELASADSAAKRRTAISRAYYAAFHVGAQTLRAMGFRVSRGGAGHGEVAHCFANSANRETNDASRWLSDLHSFRNRADYHLDAVDVELPGKAAAAVANAQSIIDAIDRILSGPNRAQLQATIAAWRKGNGYP